MADLMSSEAEGRYAMKDDARRAWRGSFSMSRDSVLLYQGGRRRRDGDIRLRD